MNHSTNQMGIGTSAPEIGERGREWPRDLATTSEPGHSPVDNPMDHVDTLFAAAVLTMLELFDMVDLDREMIREEMGLVQARWADAVGSELATIQDAAGIENAIAKAMGID